MSNTNVKDNLRNIELFLQKSLKIIFSAIIGFLFSKTGIKNVISPFSVSFLAVSPFSSLSYLSVYIGIISGYLTNDFSLMNFKYICANSVVLVMITIAGKKNYINNIYSPILPAIVTAGVGVIFLFAESINTFSILLLICECILSGCGSFFLKYFIITVKSKSRMDTKDIVALNITLLIFLLSVENYYIFGISVSMVILILLIYICSFYLEIKLSLPFTLSLCFIISLLHTENTNLFLTLYIPSIASILITKLNKKYIVPTYFASYCTINSIIGITFFSIKNLLIPIVSGVIFYLIPKVKLGNIINTFFHTTENNDYILNENELCIQYCQSAENLISSIESKSFKPIFDENTEKYLLKFLRKEKCENIELSYYYGNNKKIISLMCDIKSKLTPQKICEKLCEITEHKYEITDNKSDSKIICSKFIQKDLYKIDCYGIYKPKNGEKICGDNLSAFKTASSHFNIILADGMGSGKEAYSKSLDTINILKRLLKSEIEPFTAIKTANSSISMVKDEIGFSTIDLCIVSLKSGTAEFYKCGAYLSFILREKTLIQIKEDGLPAGLYSNIAVSKQEIQLIDGDIIIMMSDGVAGAIEKIEASVLLCQNRRPEFFARELIDCASQNTPKELDDDMTIIISKFSKN